MTEPIVNRSIKGLSQLKGNPASAARFTPKYYDREPPFPNASAVPKGILKTPDDITTPLKQSPQNHLVFNHDGHLLHHEWESYSQISLPIR